MPWPRAAALISRSDGLSWSAASTAPSVKMASKMPMRPLKPVPLHFWQPTGAKTSSVQATVAFGVSA